MKFSAKNPHLRVAAKRWQQLGWLVDKYLYADKVRSTKMQIDFSLLTVYNMVTNYITLTKVKRNSKSGTEKKIGFRGQFSTQGHHSRSR